MGEIYLLDELHKRQNKKGYVSEKDLKELSVKLDVPISKLYGTVTFYSHFRTTKQGKNVIEVCNSPSCHLNGSFDLLKELKNKLKIEPGQTTKDNKFTLYKISCIGCCDKAPAIRLNGKVYTELNKNKLNELLKKCKS